MDKDRPPRQNVGARSKEQWTEARQGESTRADGEWDIDEGVGVGRVQRLVEASKGYSRQRMRPMGPAAAVGSVGGKQGNRALRLEANPWHAGVGHHQPWGTV